MNSTQEETIGTVNSAIMIGMPNRHALSVWVLTPTSSVISSRGYEPQAVFSTARAAAAWIAADQATCLLTEYPLDISVYDWATSRGYFTPKRHDQRSSAFIETFSDASQAHCHFENGQPLDVFERSHCRRGMDRTYWRFRHPPPTSARFSRRLHLCRAGQLPS
jgi:hypothetical protein